MANPYEAKGKFEARLRADGRWPAFLARRESLVRELTPQFGGDERAARRKAWEVAMAEYGSALSPVNARRAKNETPQRGPPAAIGQPLDVVASQGVRVAESQPNGIVRETFAGKPKSTVRADLAWVYENIQIEDPSVEDCPSAGAWGLLWWAKQASNQCDFYRLWSGAAKAKSDLESLLERFSDDGGVLSLIDKVAAAAAKAAVPVVPSRLPDHRQPPDLSPLDQLSGYQNAGTINRNGG